MNRLSQPRSDGGFTLVEVLVSVAIFSLILVGIASLMNMTSLTYRRISSSLDSFESARAAFDTISRTVNRATLLSYLGYDDPLRPTEYLLRSDLHFVSGRQSQIGLSTSLVAPGSHAMFFQAPLGFSDLQALQNAKLLLNCTGFFLAYGDDPLMPDILKGKTLDRRRFRLYQLFQPREDLTVYDHTIAEVNGVRVGVPGFMGPDWYAGDASPLAMGRPLAENIVAMAILPVSGGTRVGSYEWNSRDGAAPDRLHRLPDAVHVVLAAIGEDSAARFGNPATPPALIPDGLFVDPADFEDDLAALDAALAGATPPVDYRIFSSVIPIGSGGDRTP